MANKAKALLILAVAVGIACSMMLIQTGSQEKPVLVSDDDDSSGDDDSSRFGNLPPAPTK